MGSSSNKNAGFPVTITPSMAPEIEADLSGHGLRIGIIVARFNEDITRKLLSGAFDTLVENGVSREDISVVWVPGSMEIPLAASQMGSTGAWSALVVLGAVIRGETYHFELVAIEAARGISEISRHLNIPIGFGVLAAENEKQANERSGGRLGNRGSDAAMAALEMANLSRLLNQADNKV